MVFLLSIQSVPPKEPAVDSKYHEPKLASVARVIIVPFEVYSLSRARGANTPDRDGGPFLQGEPWKSRQLVHMAQALLVEQCT